MIHGAPAVAALASATLREGACAVRRVLLAAALLALAIGCGGPGGVPSGDRPDADEATESSPTAPSDESAPANGDVGAESADRTGADGTPPEEGGSDAAAMAEGPIDAQPDGRFVLGDLVPAFEPPTLDELVDAHQWEDGPVVDALARVRAEEADAPPPEVSVEEALAMRNDSEEDNRKILSALSALPPEDESRIDQEASITRVLQQDLASLNPILASSTAESDVLGLTGFGLWGYDAKFQPFASADTVRSWRRSKDGMVDLVEMRDDLTWSDGAPITAHDVAFSFRVIMSSRVPVPAMRTGTNKLKAVVAYDDHTLAYFHMAPLATNVWNINFSTIPKHVYEASIGDDPTMRVSSRHAELEKNPVVGGAYEIARRRRGQEIVLRRRDSWWKHKGEAVRDKPYFREVRFRILEDPNTALLALKAGDLDETRLGPEQWLTQTGDDAFYRSNVKVRGDEWTFFYIGWNLTSPLFEDVRVRRAMAHAMNYDEMLDVLCYGLYRRCEGPFHRDSWMFPEKPPALYEYDLDKAEDLLDEAGWGDEDDDGVRDKRIGGRLVPFRFSLLVSNKPERIAVCNLLREDLESIGVDCDITPLEAAVFQQRVFEKKFEAEMAGWGAGADPYTSYNIFGSGEDRNYGQYSNPEVDRLFLEAEREFDPAKRARMYGRINNLVYEDQPYLFLYTWSSFFGFHERLRGYRFSPRGPYAYSPGFSSIWTPAQ